MCFRTGVQLSPPPPKENATCFDKSHFLLGFAPAGRSTLRGLKCSGEVNSPCAKVLPVAKRLYGAKAPPARRPVGCFSRKIANLDPREFDRPERIWIVTPCQKERHLLSADVFLFGFRPPKSAETLRNFNASGRQSCPCAILGRRPGIYAPLGARPRRAR